MKNIIIEILLLLIECFWTLTKILTIQLINIIFKNVKVINNDVILITGAARGIGKELVIEFAKYKPKCIILWDVNGVDELEKTVIEIKSLNIPCEYQLCDVSDFKNIRKNAEEVILKHKSVDILVNNAGIVCSTQFLGSKNDQADKKSYNEINDKVKKGIKSYYNSDLKNCNCDFINYDGLTKGMLHGFHDYINDNDKSGDHINNQLNDDDFDLIWMEKIKKTVEVNTLSHFWMLRCFVPSMVKNNHGHIVSMISVLGLLPLEDAEAYCSSKFAARGLAECFKLKLANLCPDVLQTVVYPYLVNTEMFKGCETRFPWLFPSLDKSYVGKHIVQAVLSNQRTLFLPWTMKFFYYAKLFLPDEIVFLLYRFLHLDQAISKMKSE